MTSVTELVALGTKIGLTGDQLQSFIREQQEVERQERARDRDYKSAALEHEKIKLNLEKEKAEREIEKARVQLELKKLAVESGQNGDESFVKGGLRGPKMPPFDEDKDNMDSFIYRFERYAEAQKWQKTDWSVYLAALLRGKSLDVYSRMPETEANDYDVLKAALLRRFQLTEEGFKQRFHSAKPESGESPSQFIARLDNYLQRWIDMAKIQTSYEGLKGLILREQYLTSCRKDLALFLKERAVTDMSELTKLAEQFLDAHISRGIGKESGQITEPETTKANSEASGRKPPQTTTRKCGICNRTNHMTKDCFYRHKAGAMVRSGQGQGQNFRRSTPNQPQHYTGGNGHSNIQNLPKPTNPPQVYCRAHGKVMCSQCMSTTPVTEHVCNALLAPQVELKCGCRLPVIAEACRRKHDVTEVPNMPVTSGKLYGNDVRVLRDSGCSTVVVKRDLVPDECFTGDYEVCVLIDGTARRVPRAKIDIETPFYTGTVDAICMRNPLYDLIIGNITGVEEKTVDLVDESHFQPPESTLETSEVQNTVKIAAVQTRAQSKQANKAIKPLVVPQIIDENICSPSEFVTLQQTDETLKPLWQKATDNEQQTGAKGVIVTYCVKREFLYRMTRDPQRAFGNDICQLVVPSSLRNKVLELAHSSTFGGHLGIRKTYERVLSNFHWVGLHGDVTRFCRSCDICQKTIPRGKVAKIPLGKMPLIETPFERIAVDLIGPIFPASDRGHRYILTMIDYATRYPEAVALKSIEAETVAEALVTFFSRVGIPSEILSDQGTQFVSGVAKEMNRLLSIRQMVTTPYHPICNGLVEKFNGTLKSMLKKMCNERPKDWDRYLAPILFAYREVPQESTGFSPFELLYGRTVRGPMSILRELWSGKDASPDVRSTYEYVVDLKDRLEETCKLARNELEKAQCRQKRLYDTKAKDRSFKPGDEVLLLLPTDQNKLLLQWQGPYKVLERVRPGDYRIQMPTRVRTIHANLLKKYFNRDQDVNESEEHEDVDDEDVQVAGTAVLEQDENDEELLPYELPLNLYSACQKETVRDVKVNPELTLAQRNEVLALLAEFDEVFTDIPSVTNLGEHSIELTSSIPVYSRPYPVPYAMREVVESEIQTMLSMGIIEPSTASYASPVVLVRKPDGSNRVCIDFRKLNKITVFDPEPMPQAEEVFAKLAEDKYFSKFDFNKGYWQVPMREQDKDLTTFITHLGLNRFTVMPFGLVNASATFNRIMRKLIKGLKSIDSYIDDVLNHTVRFDQHMVALRGFLERVREANLTLRPTKCHIGFFQISFLGHVVGAGEVKPNPETIERIPQAERPQTKKQLKSFLGLIGYYRKFIPNFAAIAVPLTDLTKKGIPNQIPWSDAQENAYHSLKSYVVNPPILLLPDFRKEFILQTDASDTGIGAILMQEDDQGEKHPVAFASRKLLPRETRYATIERECLAIVWGIQKFESYLYGKQFTLETDHHPLQYLGSTQSKNGRLTRWAMTLQPFRFIIRAIRGKENVGADFLSRHD